ncbi:protein jag [Ornithinimicrobium sufpigmenti]|uniref:Jag family protein n=1 Tax=Ornithinimicrobium sufpigmenti TaxID=2508882 RepID=UPI001EE0D362|nr:MULTISPECIES: R3H domain-containing nucleic acid-binding protein [unclassified Ornithinimicrobium]
MSTSTSQPEDGTVLDTPAEDNVQTTSDTDETTTTPENPHAPAADEAEETEEAAEVDEVDGDTSASADTLGAASPRSQVAAQDLVREGEIAADFLETLLDIADLDGDLEVDVDGDRAAVAIVDSEDGAAPQRLVGPGGEVLEALQELTRLAVQAETGDRSRLMLDVAGYRSGRRSELVKTAQQAIAAVKESGERRELEPMTAFERKVVHDEVLAAGLHSESEGAEPGRYVVILPGS